MNSGKYVFAQILSIINSYEFSKCVKHYRGLNCWNQFVQLFFGQLTARNGLRDICLSLNAHNNSLYHLGIKQSVNESTLSRANENRDWRIFADFGACLINLVQPLYAKTPVPHLEMDNDIFVLDSTTISLILTLWSCGSCLHLLGSGLPQISTSKHLFGLQNHADFRYFSICQNSNK